MAINEKLLKSAAGAGGITPSDNFSVDIWSGDGGTNRNIPTGFDLQSNGGVVWIKKRTGSGGSDHILMDSVRGVSNFIYPNDSAVEVANGGSTHNQLKTFDSDGFSVAQSAYTNASGSTYVAWSFLGGGAASSNGDGSLTSQVSANVDAGFSICTYSGASTTSTVGHGLSSAPELIIVKGRNVTAGWPTLYNDGSNSYTMRISENGGNDNANKNLMFGNGSSHIAPTSSVFTVGNSDETNQGYNYVAYCFHSVAGYSKIGEYDGTGTTSGNFVETGFEPAWLMVKCHTNTGTSWVIVDNKRNPSNPRKNRLVSNSNALEDDCCDQFVFFTTGFRANGTDTSLNGSGRKMIYLAFAADPDTTTPTLASSFSIDTYQGSGSTRVVASKFGQAFAVNGNQTHASASRILLPTGVDSYPMSVSCWINVNAHSSGGTGAVVFEGEQGQGINFTGGNPTYLFTQSQNSTTGQRSSASPLEVNRWYHVVGVFTNSTTSLLYIDGVSNNGGVSSVGDIITSDENALGSRDHLSQYPATFDGVIDQVRIYNVTLSASDVTNLFTKETVATSTQLNPTDLPSSCIAAYSLNGNANDVSGSYNATSTKNLFFVGGDMKPDFVWIKSTSSASQWHNLQDSVRGAQKHLYSNAANAEDTTATGFTDFIENGYTLGSANGFNTEGANYVAWKWKMLDNNNDNAELNEVGTIDSLVSLNSLAGQSITTYTGNGTQNATVGNGFNTQAKLVIIKNRDQADNWFVGSPSFGTNQFTVLNSSAGKTTNSDLNYTINSTTMQFTSASPSHIVNASGERYVMYSFANITGYQKIGTYTGNNSGQDITGFGFDPDFVLVKALDSSAAWRVIDSVRGNNTFLYPSETNAQDTGTYFSLITDGIRLNGLDSNQNGEEFLYWALKIN